MDVVSISVAKNQVKDIIEQGSTTTGDLIGQDPNDETGGLITAGTIAGLDETLKLNNHAAPAKVVGDKFAELESDIATKQDTLIAGDGITIASDGKTISASGSTEKEWVLKGTITTDALSQTVDLTGCTELVLYGCASNTASNHIISNIGWLHYTAFTSGDTSIIDKFEYDGFSTTCSIMKKEIGLKKTSFNINGSYTYTIVGKSIDMITNISIYSESVVTFCDIKIYAR